MKNVNFKKILLSLILFVAFSSNNAQNVTTVTTTDNEFRDNLNLEAVASVFGDAKDLADFEKKLNDPNIQISNLDLNNDNQVDYLRVVETAEKGTHLIVIQAVLGTDKYQDIATVEVEKNSKGVTQVQIVGDEYLYGTNYIIEPVYAKRPVFFTLFWKSHYRPYRSSYYWGVYPRHFKYWKPYPVVRYRKNVLVHVNTRHKYRRVTKRRSNYALVLHARNRRTAAIKFHSSRKKVVIKKKKRNSVAAKKKRSVKKRRQNQ